MNMRREQMNIRRKRGVKPAHMGIVRRATTSISRTGGLKNGEKRRKKVEKEQKTDKKR